MNPNKKDLILVALILGIIIAGLAFQDYHEEVIKGANYSIYTNLYTTQEVLVGYRNELIKYDKQEISDADFKAILNKTAFYLTKNAYMTNKYGRHFGNQYNYVSLSKLEFYVSSLTYTELPAEELKYHRENLVKICKLWAPLTFHITDDYSKPGANLKKAIEETNRLSAEGYARIDKYLAMPEDLRGSWKGSKSSENKVFYTQYIKMEIQDKLLHTYDEEAANPGFDAKITGVDNKYIYIELLEDEIEPADWKLAKKDKIQYELYSKDELHLTHDGTTCIFFRAQDLTDAQIKVLDRLANLEWISTDSSNLGISFSYFDLELYDLKKAAENRTYVTGRTYVDEDNSVISMIPDRTMALGQNSIWPGIEHTKRAELTYELSADGKTLTMVYQGKEVPFRAVAPGME